MAPEFPRLLGRLARGDSTSPAAIGLFPRVSFCVNLRYMLDTDTVCFALRDVGKISERLITHKPTEICMSSITLSELRYGAELRNSSKLHRLFDEFTAGVNVLPFDSSSTAQFGKPAADLTRKGWF